VKTVYIASGDVAFQNGMMGDAQAFQTWLSDEMERDIEPNRFLQQEPLFQIDYSDDDALCGRCRNEYRTSMIGPQWAMELEIEPWKQSLFGCIT
jgi:hypothetical protein